MGDEPPLSENVMKILIATDNHLGYGERDPIIKHDSFVTFEEILKLAQEHEVDMILLGGDLFHDNKPSRQTIHRTCSLFRKYCLGNKECHLEFLSDPKVNFNHCDFKHANYQDPNYNISYPVFSVHGNHDDPTGDDSLSAIDVLSVTGLLNHFGKAASCDNVNVSPVLLKKGETKLALYGIGAMRDERLHTTFSQKHVNMCVPLAENGDDDGSKEWFNVFVIHQNRAKHGKKNYIPESFLEEFLDLVIWGHEHECLVTPTWTECTKQFYITQPGSSVATSLSEGEAKQKHVGLLHVYQKTFKMEPLPLQTVRQFMFDNIVLSDTNLLSHEDEKVFSYLTEKVEQLIDQAEINHTGHKDQPKLPLIRIRVEYSGEYEIVNAHRFGQQFVDRVANPKDILLFYRKKVYDGKVKANATAPDISLSQDSGIRMEDLINQYLNAVDGSLQLDVLSERKLSKALNEFVIKEEKDAILEVVKYQVTKTQNAIIQDTDTTEHNIDEIISKVKDTEDNMDENEENKEIASVMQTSKTKKSSAGNNENDGFDEDTEEENVPPTVSRGKGARGRGSRGGRGSKTTSIKSTRGGRGRGRGRGAKSEPDTQQSTIQSSFMSTAHTVNDDNDLSSRRASSVRPKKSRRIEVSSDEEDSDPFSLQSTKRSKR